MPLGFRLEVWNPILNNQNTDRWVIAQTPKNRSAVSTVLMSEELGNPRKAKINLSNRPVDFTTTGTFAYHYQQAGGANVFNSSNSTEALNSETVQYKSSLVKKSRKAFLVNSTSFSKYSVTVGSTNEPDSSV